MIARLAACLALPLAALVCTRPQAVPSVRMSIGGQLAGRLEPCGCASGQLGGLARRAHHVAQQRDRYALRLEGGNLIEHATELDLWKLDTALTVLGMARYDAVALGPQDLELPAQELLPFLAAFYGKIVASDLVPKQELDAWPAVASAEMRTPGATVRVAAFVGALGETGAKSFELLPVAEAWQRALAGAEPQTLRILFVHAGADAARAAARLTPKPDLIVLVTPSVGEPPTAPQIVEGVPVVCPGIRGRMLLDVELTRTPDGPKVTHYGVVKLADSESRPGAYADPDAKEAILAHRHIVAEEGLREKLAGQRPAPDARSYVGSQKCQSCHPAAYNVWLNSKHAQAWTTLVRAEKGELKDKTGVARYGWPVTKYPDCVACHVVAYGEQSGFVNPEQTPDLAGVGCEQCHGPGSAHIVVPIKDNILRGGRGACAQCHDFEQSPDFDYEKRWKEIEHYTPK